MDSDLEFEDMFHYQYFRASENQGYIFIQINHIVNRLLGCLKRPAALHLHDRVYEVVRQVRSETAIRNKQEFAVIRAIRQGNYRRVVLTNENGEEKLLELEQELSTSDSTMDLRALGAARKVRTMTASRHAGKDTGVQRKQPAPRKNR
jgi:hypothetical protein